MTDADNSITSPTDNAPDKGVSASSGSATPELKFTQADLDRIAGDTRKSAKEKAIADFLKDLGVDNADDARAKISAAKAKEDAEKTASEKADAARLKAEAERDALKAQLAGIETQRRVDKRDARITAAARDGGATVPEDVIAWAEKYKADAIKAVMADDGTVDEKGVKALVDAAREARPTWFRPATPGSPSNAGARGVPADTDAKKAAAAYQAQHTRGRF